MQILGSTLWTKHLNVFSAPMLHTKVVHLKHYFLTKAIRLHQIYIQSYKAAKERYLFLLYTDKQMFIFYIKYRFATNKKGKHNRK